MRCLLFERSQYQWLAGLNDGGRQALSQSEGLDVIHISAFSRVKFILGVDEVGRAVEQHDRNGVGIENIAHRIPDNASYGLDVKGLSHRFADAVQDGKFGVALAGLLQRACTRQRRSDMLTNKCEQLHVVVAECDALGVALDRQHAQRLSVSP